MSQNLSSVAVMIGALRVKSAYQKMIFLFYNQNICCGYSKETQWDNPFEHPKHMLTLMGKKIFTFLRSYQLPLNLTALLHVTW